MPAEPRAGRPSLARAADRGESLLGLGSTRIGADKAGSVDASPYNFIRFNSRQSASKVVSVSSGITKNPAKAGFFGVRERDVSGGLQGLDAGGQAALVTGGLVLVNQAARAVAVGWATAKAAWAPAASLASSAFSTFLMEVRSIERWPVLRSLRTTACLARFLADLIFATVGFLEIGA